MNGRCTNGRGESQAHPPQGWLTAPDGKPIMRQCRAHAEEVISEYVAKLGEHWTFEVEE